MPEADACCLVNPDSGRVWPAMPQDVCHSGRLPARLLIRHPSLWVKETSYATHITLLAVALRQIRSS